MHRYVVMSHALSLTPRAHQTSSLFDKVRAHRTSSLFDKVRAHQTSSLFDKVRAHQTSSLFDKVRAHRTSSLFDKVRAHRTSSLFDKVRAHRTSSLFDQVLFETFYQLNQHSTKRRSRLSCRCVSCTARRHAITTVDITECVQLYKHIVNQPRFVHHTASVSVSDSPAPTLNKRNDAF